MDGDVIDGERKSVPTALGNTYFFISEFDLMSFVASENDYKQAEPRALLECICRLVSKGTRASFTMAEAAEQMRKSGGGRSTILKELAGKIEEYLST